MKKIIAVSAIIVSTLALSCTETTPPEAAPVPTAPTPSVVATPIEDPTLVDDRPVQIEGLKEGEIVARMTIERLDMHNYPIRYGITPTVIDQGPGLFPGSAAPGDGNFAMAGHRVTPVGPWPHGPFRYVDKLQPGDVATVVYEGDTYVYQFVRNIIVDPSDVSVLNDWRSDMTFTACHPPGLATERIITQWELVS